MITLITGTPGTGKTAFAVSQLLDLDKDRPIFVHGVPNLKIEHEDIYCRSRLCDICTKNPHPSDALYVEEWNQWAPDAAFLILDEVQRIWRPRASGQAVPDAVAELEYHRHRGVDIIMLTQGPHLMDSNVRRLVGRHIHLVTKWAGRYQYEWPECQTDTTSTTGAVSRPYKLPKRVFQLYHSATVHTKHEHRKPLAFYGIFVLFAIIAVLGYRVKARLDSAINPQVEPEAQVKPIPKINTPYDPDPEPVTAPVKHVPVYDFSPRVPNQMHTAPAYDGAYTLKPAPILTSAVYNKQTGKCVAFSEGGRRYVSDKATCIAFAKGELDQPYKRLKVASDIPTTDPLPDPQTTSPDKPTASSEVLTQNAKE